MMLQVGKRERNDSSDHAHACPSGIRGYGSSGKPHVYKCQSGECTNIVSKWCGCGKRWGLFSRVLDKHKRLWR